jgi:hypothetical protein
VLCLPKAEVPCLARQESATALCREFMRTVSEIKAEWLVEIAPHYYSKKDVLDAPGKMPKGKGRSAAVGV